MTAKIVRRLLFGTLLIFILVFIIILVLLPSLHYAMLKRDLDNPIINDDYRGWKEVALDSNIRIKIPNEWKIEDSSCGIIVRDTTGQMIAFGSRLPDLSTQTIIDLVENNVNKDVAQHETEQFHDHFYGNSASTWIKNYVYEDGTTDSFVVLGMPYYSEYSYALCFGLRSNVNGICDLVEAIAFSMEYTSNTGAGDVCRRGCIDVAQGTVCVNPLKKCST